MNNTVVHVRAASPGRYDMFLYELGFADEEQALAYLRRHGHYKEPCKFLPSTYAVIVN